MKRVAPLLFSIVVLALSGGVLAQTHRPALPLLGIGENAPASTPTAADFFSDQLLQEVRLDVNSRDWETLKANFESNAYYPATFYWGNVVVRNIGIRSRGNSSRSGVKPGLRVDFNRYTDGQTFLGLKSVVLRNNTTDISNMHERLSMQLFGRMGELVSREAHTRLYVNNAYAGLYTLVESVDKTFLQRALGEDDGFLYSYERNPGDAPYYFDYVGPDQALYVPHPFKPETHETDPQPAPLVEFIRTAAESNDASFPSLIGQFVNLQKFITHVAVEVFMGESDGYVGDFGMNNFYLYRAPNQNGHLFIPWDKSETMHDVNVSIFHNMDDVDQRIQNKLMRRVLLTPALRALYLDALDACANSAVEAVPGDSRGWMEWEVDREYAQIYEAVHADPAKAYHTEDFVEAADSVRYFAQHRSDVVKAMTAFARQGGS
jgi:spore coat protein CotH